jgi:hypothetical protein
MIIKNIKEDINKDMEKLRKKNQTETQNTVGGHSSRLKWKIESQNSKIK